MAVIPFSTSFRADGVRVLKWETVTEADTCAPVILAGLEGAVGNLQVIGTFGSASVALQASNDQATYAPLDDTNGDAIAITAAGMADFSSAALQIRPHPTGGSSQDLDIYLCLREGR